MTKTKPRILFLTLLNDVGSDRIVAAMADHGAECAVAGAPESFAARSRFAATVFPLPRFGGYVWHSLFIGRHLETAVRDWSPDLIVPIDDFAARALRDRRLLETASTEVRALILRSLGAPEHFETACSRELLVDAARALGVPSPRQEAVTTLDSARRVAAAFGYPVVLKREQTCGGFGVTIVPDAARLARAFKRSWFKARAKAALRWVPGFKSAGRQSLILQEYINGQMAFCVAACSHGVLIDSINFAAECMNPPVTGASTIIRHVTRPDMTAEAAKIVAALGCSGLVSFDFILAATGEATLIEMNPRPVASGHLGRHFGHDVYKAVLDHLSGTPAARALDEGTGTAVAPSGTIALFPRELDRNPQSAWLGRHGETFHDVPTDDPDLIAVYAAWLEKRHPGDRHILRRRLKLERMLSHAKGPNLELASPIAHPEPLSSSPAI